MIEMHVRLQKGLTLSLKNSASKNLMSLLMQLSTSAYKLAIKALRSFFRLSSCQNLKHQFQSLIQMVQSLLIKMRQPQYLQCLQQISSLLTQLLRHLRLPWQPNVKASYTQLVWLLRRRTIALHTCLLLRSVVRNPTP